MFIGLLKSSAMQFLVEGARSVQKCDVRAHVLSVTMPSNGY